jgi:L-ascorbate metabolism protein UlaG (beta-lactamase superfamily)
VLVSHLHHDHLHLPSLRRLAAGTPVVVPRGGAGLLEPLGLDAIEVDAGQSVTIGAVTVEAVRAFHDGRRHPGSSWSAPALGYVVRGTRTVWFAGDTGWTDWLGRDVGACDLALLPVGGWGPVSRPNARGQHLTPVDAAIVAARMRPGTAIPIHYGTLWPAGLPAQRHRAFRSPGEVFARHVRRLAPDLPVSVLEPGETVALS